LKKIKAISPLLQNPANSADFTDREMQQSLNGKIFKILIVYEATLLLFLELQVAEHSEAIFNVSGKHISMLCC